MSACGVDQISEGIKLTVELIRPIEDAVPSGKGLAGARVTDFLDIWRKHLRQDVHRRSENAADLLVCTVGLLPEINRRCLWF